jgi:Tfp pilus assembly protein PilV
MGHQIRGARMPRGEAGFGLVEVMVTAVIVVLVATATVTSIGQSQSVSARNQARSITANLAEQDQERMRSIRAEDLSNYTNTQSIVQGGIPYQVDSSTQFVNDASGGAVSCTTSGSATEYMELTTTVTPKASLRARSTTVKSIYALPVSQFSPTSGTLSLQVFKADEVTGQPGIPVTLSGPDDQTATTNEKGCAIFQFLRPGAYVATLNAPGYVDKSGTQAVDIDATVLPATVNQATPQIYDVAGRINVTFSPTLTSPRLDTNTEPPHTVNNGVTLTNGGLPNGGLRLSASQSVTGLFPFVGPYLLYAGNCKANDPSATSPTYFSDHPTFGKQLVAPGGGPYPVTVREPAIHTKITGTGVTVSGSPTGPQAPASVTLKQTDALCSATYTTTANSDGTLVRAGYPFGKYSVCVGVSIIDQASPSRTRTHYKTTTTDVNNTNFAGVGTIATPAVNFNVTPSDTTIKPATCA